MANWIANGSYEASSSVDVDLERAMSEQKVAMSEHEAALASSVLSSHLHLALIKPDLRSRLLISMQFCPLAFTTRQSRLPSAKMRQTAAEITKAVTQSNGVEFVHRSYVVCMCLFACLFLFSFSFSFLCDTRLSI